MNYMYILKKSKNIKSSNLQKVYKNMVTFRKEIDFNKNNCFNLIRKNEIYKKKPLKEERLDCCKFTLKVNDIQVNDQ